jgi:hypothetical protein
MTHNVNKFKPSLPLFFATFSLLLSACGSSPHSHSQIENKGAGASVQAASGAVSGTALGAAAGFYSGLLVSHLSGSTLGTLQLALLNPTKTQETPTAQLTFKSAAPQSGSSQSLQLQFESVSYDPRSHQVSAQHHFKTTDGDFAVNFSGLLGSDGSLSGTFQASNYSNKTADCHLLSSVETPDDALDSSPQASSGAPEREALPSALPSHFVGSVFQSSGTTHSQSAQSAELKLQGSETNADQRFFEWLSPLQFIEGQVNFGDGSTVSLPGLVLDRTQNTLNLSPLLSCQLSSSLDHMDCSLQITGSSNQDSLILSAAQPAVPSTTLAPLNQPKPNNESSNLKGQKWLYTGTAQFENSKGKKTSRSVNLEVLPLDSASSGDSQNLRVQFLVQPAKIGIQFDKAQWNINTHDLRADQTLTAGGTSGQVSLLCASFTLQQNYDFECRYTSTIGDVQASIHFSHK